VPAFAGAASHRTQAWLSAREGKRREQDAKKKAWEDACFKIPPFKPSKIL